MSQDENYWCAGLSYFLIGLLWYAVDKKMQQDGFVKFHVKQGLVLLIFGIIWSILLSVLAVPLSIITFGVFGFVVWILSYVPLVLAIIGVVNVINKKEQNLPIIGTFSEKFKF